MRGHVGVPFNHVTGDWVIIAAERAKRPEDYIIRVNRRDTPSHVDTCPFCKNRGAGAGSSLEHPHCQILRGPTSPRT
jgi:galactose-1-phosphate uridylyltransferase